MPSTTTHPNFGANTEGLEVAAAFAPNIRGKTIIVTGASTTGIGYSTLQAFASQTPAHLILAGRTPSKLEESLTQLKSQYPDVDYRTLTLNLSSQKAVREAAAEVLSWSDIDAIDIMVNNAGIMGIQTRELTPDGIEMHFGTNHIGHFLFTSLLMPKLLVAAARNPPGATRIVNVTSLSPLVAGVRWSDINFEKKNKDLPEEERPDEAMMALWGYKDVMEQSYIPLEGYNQSKAANVLYTIALNKRLYAKYGIVSLAVHPGVIHTPLGHRFPEEQTQAAGELMKKGIYVPKSLRAGSATSLVAALDPKLAEGVGEEKDGYMKGIYMIDCQVAECGPRATKSEYAERLWGVSEDLVGEKFAW